MLTLIQSKSKALAAKLIAVNLLALWSSALFAQPEAFPGAIGFGASATGARGGTPTIYHVTTLSDSGAGSFRDAVSHSSRIIVFDVGGNIHITSPISASYNLTILGQTAPGDGIAIYGAEVSFYNRSNVICRYVRFRDTTQDPGGQTTNNSSGNCLNLGNTNNMIFDHVSCEFASYNNIDAVSAASLTFQNSLVAAPIKDQQFNFHWEGGGGDGTFINNVFVDGHNRSILAKGDAQYVNNAVYNYQAGFTSGNSAGNFNYDVTGNYFITGPSTTSSGNDIYQVDSNQSAYATGNMRDSNNDGTLNGSSQNTIDSAVVLSSPFFSSTPQLPQLSAAAAYAFNVAHAGASLKHDTGTFAGSLGYDQVDQYMINEVQTLGAAGRMWNTEKDDGLGNNGLGTLNSGSKPTDTDGDGIPDSYESAHGMSTTSSDSLKLDPLGYTMIEHYANEMADQATLTTRTWTAGSGAWTTAANWSGGALPITYDIASVQGSGTSNGLVTVSSSTPVAYRLYIGGNGPAAGEKVQVTSGKLDVLDTIFVGNTNNGTLQIDGGTVQAGNVVIGNTLSGTTYNGNVLLNGGVLQVFNAIVPGGGTPGNWTSGGSITSNGGTIQALGAVTVSAPVTLSAGGGKFDTNGNVATISSVISGSGSFTKLGDGTLTPTGVNTYTGVTTISGGILEIGSLTSGGVAGNLGAASTASTNLVLDGGTLQVDTGSGTDRGMTITAHGGTFYDDDAGGGSTIGGGIVSGGTGNPVLTFDKAGGSTDTATITGTISDSGSAKLTVTKIDSGRLSFSGAAKTYGGDTTINAGTLMAYGTNVMPYGSGKGNLVVASGATFDARFSENINGLSGAGTVTKNSSNGATLTLGNGDATAAFSGIVAGPLDIAKTGTGTQTFSDSNSYTGSTTINSGMLVNDLGGSTGVTGTISPFGTGALTVGSGAVLQLGHNPGSHNNTEFDYGNNVTLNAGTLYAEDGIQHVQGTLNVGPGGGTLGSTYNIGAGDGSKGLYLDGAVSGSGSVTLQQSGINTGNNYDTSFVVFTNNANSYSGTIKVVPMGSGKGGGSYLGLNAGNALAAATVNLAANNSSNASVFGSSPLVFATGLGTAALAPFRAAATLSSPATTKQTTHTGATPSP